MNFYHQPWIIKIQFCVFNILIREWGSSNVVEIEEVGRHNNQWKQVLQHFYYESRMSKLIHWSHSSHLHSQKYLLCEGRFVCVYVCIFVHYYIFGFLWIACAQKHFLRLTQYVIKLYSLHKSHIFNFFKNVKTVFLY